MQLLHFKNLSSLRQYLHTFKARGKRENLFKLGSCRNNLLTRPPVQDCAYVYSQIFIKRIAICAITSYLIR